MNLHPGRVWRVQSNGDQWRAANIITVDRGAGGTFYVDFSDVIGPTAVLQGVPSITELNGNSPTISNKAIEGDKRTVSFLTDDLQADTDYRFRVVVTDTDSQHHSVQCTLAAK